MSAALKEFSQWFFGVCLLFGALGFATGSLLAGLLMAIAGLLLLPPAVAYVQERVGIAVPTEGRVFAAIGLFMAAGYFQSGAEEKTKQDKQRREAIALEDKRGRERAARTDQFKKNRTALLSESPRW